MARAARLLAASLVASAALFSHGAAAVRENFHATLALERPAVCAQPFDVVFVIDGSGSVKAWQWAKMKDFLLALGSKFQQGSQSTALGIVQFASTARTELSPAKDSKRFHEATRAMSQLSGSTKAVHGLEEAGVLLAKQSRSGNRKLVFLLSDGDVSLASERVARSLERDQKALIVSISLGQYNRAGVRLHASSDQLFFDVGNYRGLEFKVGMMSTRACGAKEGTKRPPTPPQVWREGDAEGTGVGKNLCVLPEEHRRFRPHFDRWTLLPSLAQRLQYERAGKVLRLFRATMEKMSGLEVKESSNAAFAMSLGMTLQAAVEATGFTKAQVTEAEVRDFKDLGLIRFTHLGSKEQQASLKALEAELCQDMRSFIEKAEAVEAWSPLYSQAEQLWKSWQQAWGPVRVFVKVTTQCRVHVPADRMAAEFFQREYQDQWEKCSGVEPWPEGQFPSAVMACARPDGEHMKGPGAMPLLDRDHMVRYLGCGANRLQRADKSTVEPPMGRGVSEACSSQTMEARDFASAMCGAGSVTSDACRYYGPFWSVYSAPLEHIYGRAVSGPNGKCPLDGDERQDCGNPQLEAYKGMVDFASAAYVYGALPPLVASKSRLWKEGRPAMERVGWEQEMDYPLPAARRFDPPMWEILREAELGNSIILISYGYSGSGKTTTLVGDATAPVGGARGLDGVISIYLRDNAERIKDVRLRFVEIYGRVDAGTGRLMDEAGLGLWGFRLKSKSVDYLGPWSAFTGKDRKTVDFNKLNKKLSSDLYTLSVREVVAESLSGAMDWGSVMKEMLTHIEILRSETKEFDLGTGGSPPLAHIRATPNNPKSSRGTLVVSMEIDFTSGETGSVAAVDVAGAEDPAVLVEGFMRFRPAEGVAQCVSQEKWAPEASKKLIQKHMSKLNNESFLDNVLGECLKFRDFLAPCDRKTPRPECVDITLQSGRQVFVRPDVTVEEAYIHKTHRTKRDQLDFVFKYGKKEVRFTEAEVMQAKEKGKVEGMNNLMQKSSLIGKSKCGEQEDEKCPGSWVQRLWSRCGVNQKGACVRIGEIDSLVFNKKMSGNDYDFMIKGQKKKDGDRALQGIPKDVLKLAGIDAKRRGKEWRSDKPSDKPAIWKAARAKFWREVHMYRKALEAKEARLKETWEMHLKYFVSAINPMVEEGIFINEALNQMRAYLGSWATKSLNAQPGESLDLWPVTSLREQAKNPQVIDDRLGSAWTETSYDLYTFVQGRNEGQSYALRAASGQDQVMMLTMLEQLRLPAAKRGKDAKVLFGAYIRTDQPGADPNCDGAKVSLNFAQDLSESVGWSRTEGLLHFA